MTDTIITYPQETIGKYEAIVYPYTYGSRFYAMIHRAGTRQAIWECLSQETPEEALEEARAWITHSSKRIFTRTYDALYLCCLDEEWHKRTCNYWYTVTTGAMAHTAFTTKEGLIQWLDEHNLTLPDTLPENRGEYKSMRIEGYYHEASYMDPIAFEEIDPILEIAQLDNAKYTLGKVTEDEEGIRTIHYLNCNVKSRAILPYVHP